MIEIKCYEVLGHTDTTEGRGPMKVVARFTTYDVAVAYVKSKAYANWCVMGYQSPSDTNHIKENTLTIMESIDELEDSRKIQLRQSALAKLTAEEKLALGVK